MASYELIVYGETGALVGFIVDPIGLRATRSLNRIDTLAFSLPPTHHMLDDLRRWQRIYLKRNGVVEFAGLIMETRTESWREHVFTADSYEILLDKTVVGHAPETDGQTQFADGTSIADIISALVNNNLGAGATTANGRYAHAVRTNPPFAAPIVNQDSTTGWETRSDGTVWAELSDLAKAFQAQFIVSPDATHSARLDWRARPWGTIRNIHLSDLPGGNLNNAVISTNVRPAASRVIVRTKDGDTATGTAVERDGFSIAQLNEQSVTLSDTSIGAREMGIRKLSESQQGLFRLDLELAQHLQEDYRDSWGLGDRILLDRRDAPPLTVDVESIAFLVTEGGSEQIDIDVSTPFGGYF